MQTIILRRIHLCVFLLLGSQLFAQRGIDRTVATAPIFEAGAGYAFMRMTSPSQDPVNLQGINANGSLRFTQRWAGTVDLTYARSGDSPVIGHGTSVFSGLIGPTYYVFEHGNTEVFAHALIGFSWVDSAVLLSSDQFFHGYETRFSYAFGAGVEHAVSGPFALRVGADYLRTHFVDSALAVQGQNNIRLTAGVVYRFGNR